MSDTDTKKADPKKVGIGKVILLVVVGLVIWSVISSSNKPSTGNNGIDTGFGTNDASGDVSLGSCDVSFGTVSCQLTIVNSSDGTSDYYIEAEIDDSEGANVGTANALATHVGAGQTAKTTLDGVISGGGSHVTVKITTVQRTAS